MKKIIGITLWVLGITHFASAQAPAWSVNPSDYTYGMTVTATANVSCEELQNPSSKIGAFVGGTCRGVANTSNIISGKYVAFLTVYSNSTSGETIEFKVYDASADATIDASTTVLFQDGAAYGFPTSPFSIETNKQPTDISLSASTVAENVANPTVGTLTSTDEDDVAFTYTLVAGDGDDDNANFNIAGDQLSVTGTLNYEQNAGYSIRIKTDDGSCSYEEAFSITVSDNNDDPTDISLSSESIDEAQLIGSAVGTFSTTDEDVSDTHTYTLVAGAGDTDNGSFVISSGVLKSKEVFNYENKDTYSIRVSTSDGTSSYEEVFSISINDINDTPTDISLDATSFAENLSTGTTIANLTTTDEDGGDVHAYAFNSAQASNNDLFTIVGTQLRTNANFNYETNAYYTVRITTTDLEGASYTEQIVLTVNDANDPPTGMEVSNKSVFENVVLGSFVGKLSSEDEDAADTYTYTLVAGSGDIDNSSFSISNDTLYTNTTFSYNGQNVYYIRLQSEDAGGQTYQHKDTIHIKNSNDAPTDIALTATTVAENKAVGTTVGTFSSVDADAGDGHVYTLVAGAGDTDNGKFSISDGKLVTGAIFDFETKASYSVRIRTTDYSSATYEEAFTISIADANDAPTAINYSSDSLSENIAANTVILNFTTDDVDGSDIHTYSFDNTSDSDNGEFTIVADELRAKNPIDFETKSAYVIRITTNDGQGGTYSTQKILYVRDENDGPTALDLTGNSIEENNTTPTLVGVFATTDQDAGDMFNYSLVSGTGSGNNSSFSISNDTLYMTAVADYETKTSYSIRVRTTDSGSATTEQAFTITITDGNDAPLALTLADTTVSENLTKGATVADFSTEDPDAVDSFTYSLVAGAGDTDNAQFSISGSTLKTKAKFDYETKESYSIRVRTTDASGASFEQDFMIAVVDENDAPTAFAMSTDSIDENLSVNTVLLTFTTTDQDAGDDFSYSLDNSSSSDNETFTIVNDELRLNAAVDFEVKSVYFIRVKTTDLAGASYTAQKILYVRDGNDGPTAQAITNTVMAENNAAGTLVGILSTTDQDATDTFTYTLVAGTVANDNAGFSIQGDSLLVNDSLNFESKTDYTVRVKTTDAGGKSYSRDYSLTVTDNNDQPTDIQLSYNSVDENAAIGTAIGTFTTADPDATDNFQYALVSGDGDDNNSLFKLNADQLVTQKKFDFEAGDSYSIRIQSTDKGGLIIAKAFEIAIVDGNDAPTAILLDTDTISENQAANVAVITFTAVDQDTADVHTYSFDDSVESDNDDFKILGNQLLTKSAIDYEDKAIYFIRLTVADGNGGSYTTQKMLQIRNENDSPTALDIEGQSVAENNSPNTFVGLFSTTDQDVSDSFTYSLVAGTTANNNASFAIVADSLFIADSTDFETMDQYAIRVSVSDEAGATFSQNYTITVLDQNDIPTAIQLSENTIDENNAAGAVVGVFTTTDEDSDDAHTYTLVAGDGDDDNTSFTVAEGQLKLKSATNFEAKDLYRIRIRSSDGNGGTVVDTFDISVIDVNEVPVIHDTIIFVSENAAINQIIGSVRYEDVDADDDHYFRIIEGDDFSLLEATVILGTTLDYETTNYYSLEVEVMDDGGLTDTAVVEVIVEDEIEADLPLPINKIMSPNSDGKNDAFVIDNADIYADYSLKIFNNSGFVIYEVSGNYDNSWRGTFEGETVEQGVYYYLLQSNTNPDDYYKGSFSIIR